MVSDTVGSYMSLQIGLIDCMIVGFSMILFYDPAAISSDLSLDNDPYPYVNG
jgi:hypothetical protein